MTKHNRSKKNFKDAQYPEDVLKVVGPSEVEGAVNIEIIRKIDNGGKKRETEVTPFTLAAKDIDTLKEALARAAP